MVSYDPESEPIIAMVFSSPEEKDRNIFFKKENLRFPFPSDIEDRYWFRKTRVFFTDHVAGAAGVEAARIAMEAGVEVVVDIERKQDNIEDLLYYSSHVVVGERFATEYSGSQNFSDQVRSLQKRDFQTIVVTRGENGAICKINEQIIAVPGFKVQVRDTTGCGDVFHGAYAFFIARKYPIERAVFLANAAAAIKAGYKGGRPGIPVKKDLDEFIEKRKVITDFR
jgi:sugar/nucleoside kinase (ribokinase family)